MIKDMICVAILLVFGWVSWLWITRYFEQHPQQAYYDCSLSEFAPDFPTWAREQCRQRRLDQINHIKD
jgi:hypothetical protein